jgi:superoxide reductase
MKFYRCKHCGNIITLLEDSGVIVSCCGEKMTEIEPCATDAAVEKHVPVVSVDGYNINVNVGAIDHPMLPEHYIRFIVLETDKGYQIKNLTPGEKPRAAFKITDGEVVTAVYAYCNLHSLWINS